MTKGIKKKKKNSKKTSKKTLNLGYWLQGKNIEIEGTVKETLKNSKTEQDTLSTKHSKTYEHM